MATKQRKQSCRRRWRGPVEFDDEHKDMHITQKA